MDSRVFDDPEFKKEFWVWYDNLPVAVRHKFMYYSSDMSELNFYNTVWRHKEGNSL